ASATEPGLVSRIGPLGGDYYSSEPLSGISSIESQFGGTSRSFSQPLYRMTARFDPGSSYGFGPGANGVTQYYLRSGGVIGLMELYSYSFRSVAIVANIIGRLTPRIPF